MPSKREYTISLSVSGVQAKVWCGNWLWKWDSSISMPSGLIECLASRALDYLTVDGNTVPHVHYAPVKWKRGFGCKCQSFIRPGDSEISMKFYGDAYDFDTFLRIPELKPFLKDVAIWFLCDTLMYNEDRHLGNLSLIATSNGALHFPPLFDMGNALSFVDEPDYDRYEPNPFSKEQIEWAHLMLKDSKIYFDFMNFYNHVDRSKLVYPKTTVDRVLDEMMSCAYSDFISSFMEVA